MRVMQVNENEYKCTVDASVSILGYQLSSFTLSTGDIYLNVLDYIPHFHKDKVYTSLIQRGVDLFTNGWYTHSDSGSDFWNKETLNSTMDFMNRFSSYNGVDAYLTFTPFMDLPIEQINVYVPEIVYNFDINYKTDIRSPYAALQWQIPRQVLTWENKLHKENINGNRSAVHSGDGKDDVSRYVPTSKFQQNIICISTDSLDASNTTIVIYDSDSESSADAEDDADVLHGKIRFIKKNDKTYLYLVKNRGNHRFVMKKLANKGTSTKHLFKIKFHARASLSFSSFCRLRSA